MKGKIISCQGGICYSWYKDYVGMTVEVEPIGGINKDFTVKDSNIKTAGTIIDSGISGKDIQIL